ncbi:uncharacterized protein LOC124998082 [Mugil cephalus]|uniref:uncharacterized protein LOC124998082 n=1 Tax=Mugil cephalus TaxID=48193 RepID=UPI001FB6A864|nr:uncharacterized protein LOC124998082 [Mugil cephalus]
MASTRWSASVLLASLILLYWTTSSAWSHNPHNPTTLYRTRRDLDPGTRDKVEKSLETVKDSLALFKDVMEKIDTTKLTGLMKGIASFASVAPGIGAVVSSFINMVLIFIPQEDVVLTEVKLGFAEVNRKLDSLSIQIANLATDVEWFNYASVYSQDELRILNAWRKFDEFFNKAGVNDYNQLAELFTNYYEYTQAEASVSNLYHYLTVKSTSLSRNLNNLLMRKFKCSISEIGKYNLYFSSLLWKGIVLNEVYWKLIGFDSTGKVVEHAQMFKNVYEAQRAAVETCLNNLTQYVTDDAEEIAKKLSPDKTAIANEIKKKLDAKYNWYNWVVLVYDEAQNSNHILFDVIKIPIDGITVAVAYTAKGQNIDQTGIKETAKRCFENQPCQLETRLQVCRYTWSTPQVGPGSVAFTEQAKVTQVAAREDFVELPVASFRVDCTWGYSTSKISIHYSWKMLVCTPHTCSNGQCKRLLDSNEWLCECQDGYYGDRCEKKIDSNLAEQLRQSLPQRSITTTHGKLKSIESKLDQIMSRCQTS